MANRKKVLRGSLDALHILVGLGGLAGGLAAVSNPAAPMGMSTEALRNGPFTDFLIPGLFLMGIIGLGNLAGGFVSIRRMKYSGIVSGGLGVVLMAWIVIQCWMLQAVVALHAIFFCIGAIQGLLAFALLYEEELFPASILKGWVRALRARHSP
jgi:hypothetical protein